MFAGGTQIRAFLSATDLSRFVVDHLDAALESGEPIFNLGNPDNAISVWASPSASWRCWTARRRSSTATRARSTARSTRRPSRSRRCPCWAPPPPVGWEPRIGARRADPRDRRLLPPPRGHPRSGAPPAPRGCRPPGLGTRPRTPRRRRGDGVLGPDGPAGRSAARGSTCSTWRSTASTTTGSSRTPPTRRAWRRSSACSSCSAERCTYEIAYGEQDLIERLDSLPAARPRRPLRAGAERARARAAADPRGARLRPGPPGGVRGRASPPRGRSRGSSGSGWCPRC